MASKPNAIVENPGWSLAQRTFFQRLQNGLPVLMGYLGEEIPVLDNHSNQQIVDETGLLKQIKKTTEKAEKAHVERLKSRIGDQDSMRGSSFKATYRGSSRVILKQEAAKELVDLCDSEGIHIGRLMAAIKSGRIDLSMAEDVFLKDEADPNDPGESNRDDFFTTAAGGRSLYVEPIT